MDPSSKKETFFSQLRKLASHLEKQVPALQEQVQNPPQNTHICQLRTKKTLSDLRADVKVLKSNHLSETKKLRDDVQFLGELIAFADTWLTKAEKNLTDSESYLKQYGYTSPEPVVVTAEVKEEKTEETEKKEDIISSVTTTEANSAPPPTQDVSRTPKLEDRGISKYTMEFLRSASKKTQVKNDPLQALQHKQPLTSVPDIFQHDGILVTPSLLGSRQSSDESIVGFELHAALASPVPPVLETPGIKQIQKHAEMFPDPTTKLPFDKNPSDSPAVPTFQTPGLTKQIAKIAPRQAAVDKKKAVIGLFQEETATGIKQEPLEQQPTRGIKQEPVEHQPPRMDRTYVVDSEPQPPDLTYSLEAMSEMTGVYSIVSKMPKAPESLAEKLLQDKQNNTPPEPELLSDRLSRLGDNTAQKRTLHGDMPPPPKLFGKYSWMNKENSHPS